MANWFTVVSKRAFKNTVQFTNTYIFGEALFVVIAFVVIAFINAIENGIGTEPLISKIVGWNLVWIPVCFLAVSIVVVFIIHWFTAQSQIWKEQRNEIVSLRRRLYTIPDECPLSLAIEYIRENTSFGHLKQDNEIRTKIFAYAIDGQLRIEGKCKRKLPTPGCPSLVGVVDDYLSTISPDILKSSKYHNIYGESKRPAIEQIVVINDNDDLLTRISKSYNVVIYYDPVVSMRQIKRLFDDR